MSLSTHILDTALGRPAANVALALWQLQPTGWHEIGTGCTDADGRCKTLLGNAPLQAGEYSIRFETGAWYASQTPPNTTTSPSCSPPTATPPTEAADPIPLSN
jgi:5-hydroxyisourate hydrolase